MSSPLARSGAALILVDVQVAFDDPWWGRRDNPDADRNIARLLQAWTAARAPVVYVRHDSVEPGSLLAPDAPGNALKAYFDVEPALLVRKTVNSAFLGEPNLDAWLRDAGIEAVVIAGMTTNHCCETTARFAGNLGYRTTFVLDATHSHDRQAPDGAWMAAEELARATATSLHGEFADVVSTDDVLGAVPSAG